MSSAIAYVNGRVCREQDAVISVFDHGVLFGDGVYEALRTYHQEPFLLDRHIRRLRASARMLAIDFTMTDADLEAALRQTMRAFLDQEPPPAGPPELLVRILVTRGLGNMTYEPKSSPAPSLIIIVQTLVPPAPALFEQGVDASLVSVVRNHPQSVNPLIKSNNLLNNALAMQEALTHGSFEAILRNYRGELAECSKSNLFLVKGGVVRTPPLSAGLLGGLTREFVLEIAPEAGVVAEEATLRDEDLFGADEAFVSSTSRELVPVVRVDRRPIGTGRPGPVTHRLLQVFRERAERLCRPAR
jgi:branched-chain amino acid aminotransferase